VSLGLFQIGFPHLFGFEVVVESCVHIEIVGVLALGEDCVESGSEIQGQVLLEEMLDSSTQVDSRLAVTFVRDVKATTAEEIRTGILLRSQVEQEVAQNPSPIIGVTDVAGDVSHSAGNVNVSCLIIHDGHHGPIRVKPVPYVTPETIGDLILVRKLLVTGQQVARVPLVLLESVSESKGVTHVTSNRPLAGLVYGGCGGERAQNEQQTNQQR
jgi:hypothetical protein